LAADQPAALVVGIPRETKEGEKRVALEPAAVRVLVSEGNRLHVEAGAGSAVGHDDDAYRAAGARICSSAQAWHADLIVKVKEIQPEDVNHLQRGRTIFSFHHLPGEPQRTLLLAGREATAIAFEMVRDDRGEFPLLAPMSVIAGRMAIDVGTGLLARGTGAGRCLILGAGHAGLSAARRASGLGMSLIVLTRSERSRDAARNVGFDAELATPTNVELHAVGADLVVGAVFVPGQPTPKLLSRALVRRMKRGAALVDVSIDAGGVAETSRPTTHADPTYVDEGVVHYCVGNMPAALPREGAAALSAAVLPFARELASKGVARAVRENRALRAGVLVWKGRVNHPGIAAEAGLPYTSLSDSDLA
jgi:alanine dehydrogenase